MSPHQAKTALRVANVPEAEFERQVESHPEGLGKIANQVQHELGFESPNQCCPCHA